MAEAQSEQQRLDPVGVDAILEMRPGEDGEAAVLRGHEREGIMLIVDKLRRGEVPRSTKVGRANLERDVAHNRLRHHYISNGGGIGRAVDLRSKSQQLVFRVHYGSTVYRREPGQSVDGELLVEPGIFSNVTNGVGFVGAGFKTSLRWVPADDVIRLMGFFTPSG